MQKHVYRRYADGRWLPVDSTVYTYSAGRGATAPDAPKALMFDSRTGYLWQNGQWQPREATMDTYNLSGRLASSTGRQFVNGKWMGSQRYLYVYNALGDTLAQYMMLPHYGDTWDTFSARLCGYDTLRRRVTTLCWQDFGTDRYAGSTLDSTLYDTLGRHYRSQRLIWTAAKWDRSRANMYSYDGYGHRTSDLALTADQGLWQPNTLDSFGYDDQGRLLMKASFVKAQAGRGWKPTLRADYLYDSQGDTTIINIREYSPGIDTTGTAMTDSLAYDDRHHCLTRLSWTEDNGTRIPGMFEQSSYTPQGLLTARTSSVWRDDHWEPIGRTEYRYDARGYRTGYVLGSYADGAFVPELEEVDYYETVK